MKALVLLPVAAVVLFAGCKSPQPVVIDRHHHHYYRPSTPTRPTKASPSVTSESPSEFRALEKAD